MPKPCGGHLPWLDVGVAVTSGDDQDHPAAEGTMVLVLSAVVPWAFRNAKAFQGIDQEAGCDTPAQGLIGLIGYSYQQVATSFPEAGLQRTPRLSVLGPEKFGDG